MPDLAKTHPSMQLLPVRLRPGDDLRSALTHAIAARGSEAAFVLSAIGSLGDCRLRFAQSADEITLPGPFEIISISGSITPGGAHLHMAVSDAHGRVYGGHVCHGNIVRTTVEAVLVLLPGWSLTREPDPATGYDELVVRVAPAQA